MPIAIMIPCIVIIVENILTFTGGEMLVNIIITSIREIITGIISAAMQVLFWVTLVFVIIVMISNPNLFNPSFITYMTEALSDSVELKNLLFSGPIFIFLLVAVLDSYQGFRKASIRLTKDSGKRQYHIPPTDLK